VGRPTIIFLINGRPLSVNYLAENVPAMLEGWYLGEETGNAAADVLFGDYNPGGRLPITFPRNVGQIPAYYNHKPSAKRGYLFSTTEPLFAFGYGLSYTTFRYDNLNVSPEKIKAGAKAVVSVDVTNTGTMGGDEVVQVYIHDQVSSVTRPVMELKAFRRIHLEPAETMHVQFPLGSACLAFLDEPMNPAVEPGIFDVMVGPSSIDLKTVHLQVEE
jgi:beta-glucosidase